MNYLALDIGNVICDVDLNPFFSYMNQFDSKLSTEEAFIVCEEMQPRLDLALSSIDSELERICLHHNRSRDKHHKELKQLWLNSIKPVPQINEILNELILDGVKIALLSNIGMDHATVVRNILPIDNCLQHFSCEVGARKPSKLYFQSFELDYPQFWNGYIRSYSEDMTSYYPQKPLYIDDRRENLFAAENYFHTQYFSIKDYTDYDLAASKLKELLLHNHYLSSPAE